MLYYHTALGEDIKEKEEGGRERETEENAFITLLKNIIAPWWPLEIRNSINFYVLLLLLKEAFGSPTKNTSKRCSMSA